MTANDIICLLTIAIGNDGPFPEGQWFQNSIVNLRGIGLINTSHDITPRGELYIRMLKETPLPLMQWVDPRATK